MENDSETSEIKVFLSNNSKFNHHEFMERFRAQMTSVANSQRHDFFILKSKDECSGNGILEKLTKIDND